MAEITLISLDLIDDPVIAMRTELDDEQLDELMASMKSEGLIEPVVLRPVGDRYEVIAGHRRTRAARLLNWPNVEAKIISATDDQTFAMRVAENLTRKDLDPVDEAQFLGETMLKYKKTDEELAYMINRRIEWVRERLEVFNMPDYIQAHLKLKKYPLGAALWIARITNENTRCTYANWAAVNGVSVQGAKRWHDLERAGDNRQPIKVEEIMDQNSGAPRVRNVVPCAKCGRDAYMDESLSVWVHRSCP